jgi:DNA-binding Lrp family transcriptional regulator
MDAIDRTIVALMREDARRSFKDIGTHVNLSAPAVKRRVDDSIKQAVEGESGVVSAHTVAGEASALLHVMAEDTQDLELCLERIRATDGISRTVTEVVLSTLFER